MNSAIHNRSHTTTIMLWVVAALIPGILLMTLGFGAIVLWHLLLACVSAIAFEAIILRLRQQPNLAHYLMDGSAVVTALLLAISLPPHAPWWLFVLGAFLAIVFGKQLYGGLGQNLFNPAMVGYVMLLVAMPTAMTHWASPHFPWMPDLQFDAITQATPLDTAQVAMKANKVIPEALQQRFGSDGIAAGFEWMSLAWLVGGLMLFSKRLIAWRLPVTFLSCYFALSVAAWTFSGGNSIPVAADLLSGSLFFAAFFIITDPVTAATSHRGQLIFAAGIAFFTFLIRHFGTYSDGIAFAVLLMNGCVPLIDHFTVPKLSSSSHG